MFIMDVSKSSAAGAEISSYLLEVEQRIKEWYTGMIDIKVKHRAGDEIIFIAQGYPTAYITAFFISRLWKYERHMPYFGLAYGKIDDKVKNLDVEKWIHPIVKQARMASDSLKMEQKGRETFLFRLEAENKETEMLLNRVVRLQHALETQQTEVQRLVCSMYLIFQKQNLIARLLGKSAPTIYSHFKKGHCELILDSYKEVRIVLDSYQAKELPSNDIVDSGLLEAEIRKIIRKQPGIYLTI
ncbi:hypothetical protein [Bacillus sp. REN3]|uniref:hypothetical protein n=1 Tax=Bacillus sp. REN3 TaxID=2802440 RepID=UPI001AEE17C9|nr:hypothetical protein [Bacillus sp. REN3]